MYYWPCTLVERFVTDVASYLHLAWREMTYSVTLTYVASIRRLRDVVFILKFLWSFYEPLTQSMTMWFAMCLCLFVLAYLYQVQGRPPDKLSHASNILTKICLLPFRLLERSYLWACQLTLLPLHFGNIGRIYRSPVQKTRQKRKKAKQYKCRRRRLPY